MNVKHIISCVKFLEKCEEAKAIEALSTIAQLLKENANGSLKGATLNKEVRVDRLLVKIMFGGN